MERLSSSILLFISCLLTIPLFPILLSSQHPYPMQSYPSPCSPYRHFSPFLSFSSSSILPIISLLSLPILSSSLFSILPIFNSILSSPPSILSIFYLLTLLSYLILFFAVSSPIIVSQSPSYPIHASFISILSLLSSPVIISIFFRLPVLSYTIIFYLLFSVSFPIYPLSESSSYSGPLLFIFPQHPLLSLRLRFSTGLPILFHLILLASSLILLSLRPFLSISTFFHSSPIIFFLPSSSSQFSLNSLYQLSPYLSSSIFTFLSAFFFPLNSISLLHLYLFTNTFSLSLSIISIFSQLC